MPNLLWSYLTVAVGGAAGAVARFGLTTLFYKTDFSIPVGTLGSNLLGCLVMGIVAQLVSTAAWFHAGGLFPDYYRLLFAVGFCGSFTTLSALIFELNAMLQRDQFLLAFGYFIGTLIGGFMFFYIGAILVRMFVDAQ